MDGDHNRNNHVKDKGKDKDDEDDDEGVPVLSPRRRRRRSSPPPASGAAGRATPVVAARHGGGGANGKQLRTAKRQKYEAKQRRLREQQQKQQQQQQQQHRGESGHVEKDGIPPSSTVETPSSPTPSVDGPHPPLSSGVQRTQTTTTDTVSNPSAFASPSQTPSHPSKLKQEYRDWIEQHSSYVTWIREDDIVSLLESQKDTAKRRRRRSTSPNGLKIDPLEGTPAADGGAEAVAAAKATDAHDSDRGNDRPGDSPRASRRLEGLLAPYADLQNQNHRQEPPNRRPGSDGGNNSGTDRWFVAEGTETVRVLLQRQLEQQQQQQQRNKSQRGPSDEVQNRSLHQEMRDDIGVLSIFCKHSVFFEPPVSLVTDVERIIHEWEATTAKNDVTIEGIDSGQQPQPQPQPQNAFPFHILLGSQNVQSQIVGFSFGRGALACGIVPRIQSITYNLRKDMDDADANDSNDEKIFLYIQKLVQRKRSEEGNNNVRLRMLACDGIDDPSDLGSMIRCASAFHMDCLLLSHSNCCDAWYRRSVRVSMGHVFRVPCLRVNNLAHTLRQLQQPKSTKDFGIGMVSSYAVVCDRGLPDVKVLEDIPPDSVQDSWCCVMGNALDGGVSQALLDACTYKIRIGSVDADDDGTGGGDGIVDSLNVPITTGIVLHGLKERETKSVTLRRGTTAHTWT